jgi:hypothetical protein
VLIPAQVVQAPWLQRLEAKDEDVSAVIETARGSVRIEGMTALSTFTIMPPEIGGGLHLQQAIARYMWDGETSVGMLERSIALGDQG